MNAVLVYLGIFLVKMIEVSIATIRIVLITKEERLKAGIIAFFEVLIWIGVVSVVLDGITEDPLKAVVYALAFALGNVLGSKLENKIGIGTVSIEVIVHKADGKPVSQALRQQGIPVTAIDAYGMNDARELLLMRVPRRKAKKTMKLVRSLVTDCVITITDVKPVSGGYRVFRK